VIARDGFLDSTELNLRYEALAALGSNASPGQRARYIEELRRRRAKVADELAQRRARARQAWAGAQEHAERDLWRKRNAA
jgi:hypothetical protein